MNDEQQTFYYLGVALALGLLIGVERGWKTREGAEGQRHAGGAHLRAYRAAGRQRGAAGRAW